MDLETIFTPGYYLVHSECRLSMNCLISVSHHNTPVSSGVGPKKKQDSQINQCSLNKEHVVYLAKQHPFRTLVTGVSGLIRITVAAKTKRKDRDIFEPLKIKQNC